ncbi:GyrI-like domain-containing protein [Nostoc sp. UIC 10607]|uniref:GyrI-like domain-containing protein n=1 Tax=Nostoc sp. UIC 10607 TaxID=3045935 RepID=UPI0039A32F12
MGHLSFSQQEEAYAALVSWIEANGYKINGANREVYIIGCKDQDHDVYVTEVQFPVSQV